MNSLSAPIHSPTAPAVGEVNTRLLPQKRTTKQGESFVPDGGPVPLRQRPGSRSLLKLILRTMFAAALICSFTATARAADYQGYVVAIMAVGGKVFVQMANGFGHSVCSGGPRFFLDPTLAYDKAMLTLSITAKAEGSLVYVGADDACVTGWPYDNSQQLTAINVMQ